MRDGTGEPMFPNLKEKIMVLLVLPFSNACVERITDTIAALMATKAEDLRGLARWSAREDASKSLRDSWHAVIQALKSIKDDCTEKPVTRQEAAGILSNLEKLKTAVMVVAWNVFFGKNKENESSNSGLHCRFDHRCRSLRITP
ncbi:hypothetical protein WA026_020777 [Henosepilachna vigintioctopunctata]|uniref:Uncharacterized protein n=1 Tax=Henosepilachna vigintioctopunctata TaxID=420089 RepID=A0AAW1TNE0_9CUCU